MRAKRLLMTLGMVGLLTVNTTALASAGKDSLCIAVDDETGAVYIGFWFC
jgi:hypothetical protein